MTAGWGFNLKGRPASVQAFWENGFTAAEADHRLMSEIGIRTRTLRGVLLDSGVTLSQQQFDSILVTYYNVQSLMSSFLMGKVKNGQALSESDFLTKDTVNGIENKGLKLRRERDWGVYSLGVYNSKH
jgi:GH24 family phage-related lysozyme (muramidase)